MENRQLDKWIAENVMGCVPCDKWIYYNADSLINKGCEHGSCYPTQHGPPKYSTDIAAAFQVVEKMTKDGTQVQIGNNYACNDLYCSFGFLESASLADADTLSLAICLAAKKAVEEKE